MSAQGWLLLLAGLPRGMTVGFAAKAVSDEVRMTRSGYEERLRLEQAHR